jgi:hypothetical protein
LRRYISKADQSRKDALDNAIPSGTSMDASEYAKRSKEAQKISGKRMAGMQRAYQALDKKTGGQESKYKYGRRVEEVEELDEIFDTPKGKAAGLSYNRKAGADRRNIGQKIGKLNFAPGTSKEYVRLSDKDNKSSDGIASALRKLTKEEVEELDELHGKGKLGPMLRKYKGDREASTNQKDYDDSNNKDNKP